MAIKNGQSREIGNIGYTGDRTTTNKTKNTTQKTKKYHEEKYRKMHKLFVVFCRIYIYLKITTNSIRIKEGKNSILLGQSQNPIENPNRGNIDPPKTQIHDRALQ